MEERLAVEFCSQVPVKQSRLKRAVSNPLVFKNGYTRVCYSSEIRPPLFFKS